MKKLLILSIALAITASAHAGLYRWVDDNGKVHFSDKVPASASKKMHTKLDKSGIVTKKVDPELKQKRIDIKKAAKLEREQLAEIRRIKARAQAIVQKRDDNLLATYADEDELVHYFESRIKMVEGNNKILEAQNRVLVKKVTRLESKSNKTEQIKEIETISKKIVNINKTIGQYKQALNENENQIATLTEEYQVDLARFKELTK